MRTASICMATYDRPHLLRKTLESIYSQKVSCEFETIVVDDGMIDCSKECTEFPQVKWVRIAVPGRRHPPAVCRNAAYRRAIGDVIIAQSDDVMHHSPDTIDRLVNDLQPGTFMIAQVINMGPTGPVRFSNRKDCLLSGKVLERPLFFLGSLWRRDLYAVGGEDEQFIAPAYEDKWLAKCLINGRKLTPVYSDEVIGHHQDHPRIVVNLRASRRLYFQKVREAQWIASSGPWNY